MVQESGASSLQRMLSFTHRWSGISEHSLSLQALSGDAGFRRYHRVMVDGESEAGQILVDSPPALENNLAYVRTSLLLNRLGVNVPDIRAVDFNNGLFLLEDLGAVHLADRVLTADSGVAQLLYARAQDQLLRIQACQDRPSYIPLYDETLLREEMMLCNEWFFDRLLGLSLSRDIAVRFAELQDRLVISAVEQPHVLVHRDFHCRNLMVIDETDVAVIDFQDAVWGPITYDFVSLAKDCYLRWPATFRAQFLSQYSAQLNERGLVTQEQQEKLPIWFKNMGLQRHLKVLGIFARLHLRDSKSEYLKALPLVLRYCIEALEESEEDAAIASWMGETLIPHCAQQSWYPDWQIAGEGHQLS